MRGSLLFAAITMAIALPSGSSPAQSSAKADSVVRPTDQRCSALAGRTVAGGRIVSAEIAGNVSPAGADHAGNGQSTARPLEGQPFCRVFVELTPELDARVNFEIWLPIESAWNGKLLGTSAGGLEGIDHSELAGGLARGYAVAAMDAIPADPGGPNTYRFAIGRPALAKNYAYRGVHVMTVASKEVLAAFYGRQVGASIFVGCSGAGYQALGEAMRYPADYNGVVAGNPPVNFADLGLSQGYRYVVSHRSAMSAIPLTALPMIASEVLAQCDSLDGLADGIIDDPRRCRVNFGRLACKPGEANSCLHPQQVATLDALYAGLRDLRTGAQIYPGFLPGAELSGGAKVRIGDDSGASFINDGTPGPLIWGLGTRFKAQDWLKFDFGSDGDRARAAIAPFENADPDLSAFAARGGKVLLYAGWGDANINAMDVVKYYEALVRRAGGWDEARHFSRLFMAPGMYHCSGGPGPNSFGQRLAQIGSSRHDDVIKAIDSWVTEGIAPERIVATKFENDDAAARIIRSRPLCPFPKVARWRGTGSIDDANAFNCVEP